MSKEKKKLVGRSMNSIATSIISTATSQYMRMWRHTR